MLRPDSHDDSGCDSQSQMGDATCLFTPTAFVIRRTWARFTLRACGGPQVEDIAEAGRRLGVQLLLEDREPHGRGVERTAKLVVDASHCVVGCCRCGAVFRLLRGAAVKALGTLA